MNKKNAWTLLLSLGLLASCGGGSSLSSSESLSSSDNASSSDTPASFTPFKTMTELLKHIQGDGDDLEDHYGKKASRTLMTKEVGIFGDSYKQKTYAVSVSSYSNDAKVFETNQTIENVSPNYENENWKHEDHYYEVLSTLGETFYDVIDYDKNLDNDDAIKAYKIGTDISQAEIQKTVNLGLCYSFNAYMTAYVLPELIAGADDIHPTLLDGGSFKYDGAIAKTTTDSNYGLTYRESGAYTVTFDKKGMLVSYSFHLLTESASTGTNNYGLVSEVQDDFAVLDSGLKTPSESLPLNPMDYYLTDYEIQICVDDGLGQTNSVQPVDKNAFPVGTRVAAKVLNPTPSKALDTKLSFVSSSDNAVISVSEGGVAKSVAPGTCTLTLKSESGIEKTIEVTVVNPPLTSLELNMYASHVYVGEKQTIYVTRKPSNNEDTLVATLNVTEDVAKIEKGNYDYVFYLTLYKACDNLVVTVYSESNPEVKATLSCKVTEKLTEEEALAGVRGKTLYAAYGDNPKANTLHFGEDGTGYFVNNDKSQGLLFEVGKRYDFTYENGEMDYRKIPTLKVSSISVESAETYTYTNNYAWVAWDLSTVDLYLNLESEELFYFNFHGTFVEIKE